MTMTEQLTFLNRLSYVVILIVVFLLFKEKTDRQTEREELIKNYQREIKRTRQQADSLEREMEMLVIHYRNLSSAWVKSQNDIAAWRIKYEKKNKTGIVSDASYDSIINRLYPR